jgi:hypothetical protein
MAARELKRVKDESCMAEEVVGRIDLVDNIV